MQFISLRVDSTGWSHRAEWTLAANELVSFSIHRLAFSLLWISLLKMPGQYLAPFTTLSWRQCLRHIFSDPGKAIALRKCLNVNADRRCHFLRSWLMRLSLFGDFSQLLHTHSLGQEARLYKYGSDITGFALWRNTNFVEASRKTLIPQYYSESSQIDCLLGTSSNIHKFVGALDIHPTRLNDASVLINVQQRLSCTDIKNDGWDLMEIDALDIALQIAVRTFARQELKSQSEYLLAELKFQREHLLASQMIVNCMTKIRSGSTAEPSMLLPIFIAGIITCNENHRIAISTRLDSMIDAGLNQVIH